MDKKALMENLAREAQRKGGFNGVWLYAENGEIVSRGALGWRDAAGSRPVTEDSIFQLASVSKQFTATAVMLLVRRGLLALDDRITKFFPALSAYEGVTVRQLLTHTGGLPDYCEDIAWFSQIWREEKRVPGNDEILRFLCETGLKPSFAPGERFAYSNTGYNLLALLVERLSGLPYEDFLRQNVFEPAGLRATRACHIRKDGVPFENYAEATVLEDGRYVRDVASKGDGAAVTALDGLNGDDYVYSNIFDLLAWDRALREGRVLTPEEQRLMYSPGTLSNGETAAYDRDRGLGYGFGWAVGRDGKLGRVVSHSGGMPGVAAWFERYLDADRVLVFLINREAEDYRAMSGFWEGMRKLARDEEAEPIRSIEEITIKNPDRSKWESYCGSYEHPEKGDFIVDEVFLKNGQLHARAIDEDGDALTFRLYPIGESEFGRKGGLLKLRFGEGCVMFDGLMCKKR